MCKAPGNNDDDFGCFREVKWPDDIRALLPSNVLMPRAEKGCKSNSVQGLTGTGGTRGSRDQRAHGFTRFHGAQRRLISSVRCKVPNGLSRSQSGKKGQISNT